MNGLLFFYFNFLSKKVNHTIFRQKHDLNLIIQIKMNENNNCINSTNDSKKRKRENHSFLKRKKGQNHQQEDKNKYSYSSSSSLGNSPFGNYPLYYEFRYKKMIKMLERNFKNKIGGSENGLNDKISSEIISENESLNKLENDERILNGENTDILNKIKIEFPFDPRLKAIQSFVSQIKGTILDLGANLGLVGLQLLAMNEEIKVISVERDVALVNRTRMLVDCLKPIMSLSQLEELCFNSYYKIENRVLKQKLSSLLEEAKFHLNDPHHRLINIANRLEIISGDVHYMDKFWKKYSIQNLADNNFGENTIEISTEKIEMPIEMVTCFSVIKWLHLTYGDDSVKKLFQRIYNILPSGGYFIIDETPWKSYKKRRKASKAIISTWKKGLSLRPEKYCELLYSLGFEKIAECNVDEYLQESIVSNVIEKSEKMNSLDSFDKLNKLEHNNSELKKVNLGYLTRPIVIYKKK